MRLGSFLSRAALCCLIVLLAGCGGRFDRAAEPGPVLRVEVPAGATQAVLADVRAVPGVTQVAGLSIVDARAVTGKRTAAIRLAIVDRADVPAGLQIDPAGLARLGVGPGEVVKLGTGKGATHSILVADVPFEAVDTGASALVARDQVPWIASGRPTLLMVSVSPDANAEETAATLASKLNARVGLDARMPATLGARAASSLFGSFRYVVNADGTIRQDPDWVRRYIVRTRLPVLGWTSCHRAMVPQLARALEEVRRAGLAGRIDRDDYREAGGCYVARTMLWDPAKPVSLHAWGLAIDFNVAANGYGERPTMHPGIVAIFERWGFRWGGRWRTPDGMHFELASLVRG